MSLTTLQRTTFGDVTLAHRSTGDGEPVLLVHGAMVADIMAPLADAPGLASTRRILYHRRGYGDSPRPQPVVPVSPAEHAEDACLLLDHHGVDAAHVVGQSAGALIGLVMAAHHPDRVASLTLVEPLAPLASPAAAEWLDEAMPAMTAYAAGRTAEAVTGFHDSVYRPGWRARMDRDLPGGFEAAVRDAVMAVESDLPGLGWERGLSPQEIAAVRCPVLSVLGTETRPIFVAGRWMLHEWFPWCQDVDIEGGDHLMTVEHPDAVAHAAASFIAGADAR